jgi:Transglycosylase-like domain
VTLLAIAAVLPVATTAQARHLNHDPGCRSQACDLRVDVWWARHHRRAQLAASVTPFDRCVAEHESSMRNDDTGNGYYGYYQWLPATFNEAARMAGVLTRAVPTEASFAEQTSAFNAYEPQEPGAWPVSVPACGGP